MAERTSTSGTSPKRLYLKHIVRKLFLEDWMMKLTALVITFALWFGVTGLSNPVIRRVSIPLNLIVANNAEITNSPQANIEIAISGDKRKLDQLNKSDLIASMDLTDVIPGNRSIMLTPETIRVDLPQGLKLVDVFPGSIAVNVEAVEERDVRVDAQTVGSPAPGFEVYSVSVIPSNIRVRGPRSVMKNIDLLGTEKIDLSGKSEDFAARQVPVTTSDPKAAVLNTVVDVFFRIGETRVERSFSMPSGSGKTVTFTAYGPKSILSKLKADAFKADITKDNNGADVADISVVPDLQNQIEIRKVRIK